VSLIHRITTSHPRERERERERARQRERGKPVSKVGDEAFVGMAAAALPSGPPVHRSREKVDEKQNTTSTSHDEHNRERTSETHDEKINQEPFNPDDHTIPHYFLQQLRCSHTMPSWILHTRRTMRSKTCRGVLCMRGRLDNSLKT